MGNRPIEGPFRIRRRPGKKRKRAPQAPGIGPMLVWKVGEERPIPTVFEAPLREPKPALIPPVKPAPLPPAENRVRLLARLAKNAADAARAKANPSPVKPRKPSKPKRSPVVDAHLVVSGKKTRAQRKMERAHKSLEARALEKNFSPEYVAYLASPAWAELRRLFFAEIPRACAGCASQRVQLHHLTYARLGNEWWCDLVPLCSACHDRAHLSSVPVRPVSSRREPIRLPA